jgi:thiol-disulfide isomerase/thioredoxin
LVITVLSAFLTGCGGGTATSNKTPTATAAGATGTVPAALQKTALPVPRQVQPDNQTPSWFKDALAKKKVIMLEFYSKGDPASNKIRPEIQAVYEKYSTDILLIILDTKEAEKSANLADQFGVSFTPQISIIDKDGKVIREFRGYVDSKVIDQAIYDALNRKAS